MFRETEEYIVQCRIQGLAEGTLDNRRHHLDRLISFAQLRAIERWQDMTPEHVDSFIEVTEKSGMAASSRRGRIMVARAFLGWLADAGRILFNPAAHVIVHRNRDEENLPESPLSEVEVAELLESLPRRNAIDLRNIANFELLYSGGLRLGESIALDLRDVDLTNRILHVRKGKGIGGGKPRDIPMMRGLHGSLRDYLALRRSLLRGPDHGALLLTKAGKRVGKNAFSQFADWLNGSRPEKKRIHAHLLRHSIAVHLLRGGADIRHVQEFLGHESLDTTKIYLRLVPADLRKEYDKAMPEIAV